MNWKEKIGYYFILSSFKFLSLLPLKVLFLISELITFFVYHIIGYRKKVVFNNITNSFPNYTASEVKRVARKYFRHLSVMIVENIYLRFVSEAELKKRLIIENKELYHSLKEKNKSVVFMLGHFSNWEFAAALTRFIPFKGAAVYKRISSKIFDKIYFDIRKRAGVQPVEMKESFRAVHNMHISGERFALFMVADQAPTLGETNHWIKFLNQDTGVFLGSEKLAKKFDLAVVYIELLRVKKGVYRAIPTLITESAKQTAAYEITEKYFNLLEESIVKSPRYYTWSHRRWKNKKPQD